MNWFIKVVSNYANFNGRARRKEFWMYYLFFLIFYLAVVMLDLVFGAAMDDYNFCLFKLVYVIGLILPTYAVSVRRLHDVGKSAVWLLISFIPIAGTIWFLTIMCTDGYPGVNKYGSDPKGRNSIILPMDLGGNEMPANPTYDDYILH